MKVLTLHQPWASLVALGVKSIETRSWSTQYRGSLAIHAAARQPTRADLRVGAYKVRGVGSYAGGCWVIEGPGLPSSRSTPRFEGYILPLGAIVATCTLVDVVPILTTGDGPSPLSGGWVRVGDTVLGLNRGGPDDHLDFIDDQRPYGLYESSRYAWLLADVVPVDPPVAFEGGQGLTKTWEPEVVPA